MIQKRFIDSDTFSGIVQITHKFDRLQTILAYLLKLSISLNANEELDYNSIQIKCSTKLGEKTSELFSRSALDFILDLKDLSTPLSVLHSQIGDNISYPTTRSYLQGASAGTHTFWLLIPFMVIDYEDFDPTMGLPFKTDMYLQVQYPGGKSGSFEAYAITRPYLGETAFVTLHKIPFKPVGTEKQIVLENVNRIIYHTEGAIDGSENVDILSYPAKDEFLSNIMSSLKILSAASGGAAKNIKYADVVLTKGSYVFVINPDTSITDDRYLLYRYISNSIRYRPRKLLPVETVKTKALL